MYFLHATTPNFEGFAGKDHLALQQLPHDSCINARDMPPVYPVMPNGLDDHIHRRLDPVALLLVMGRSSRANGSSSSESALVSFMLPIPSACNPLA